MEKSDEFIEFFASTELYAELNKEYTTFEIFEVNAGGFEIEEVQTAYQQYLKETSIHRKRDQFSKDLNRMISNEYVLVPKTATAEMITEALLVIAVANGKLPLEKEIAQMWEKMVHKFQNLEGAIS